MTIFRGGFVEHLSLTKVAQQSVTKIIFLTILNLVTPKAGVRRELLLNKVGLRSFYHLMYKPSV
jgi:hypothetical protein